MKLKVEHRNELLSRVESSLNSVRPFLHTDGGDIEVVELTEDLILKVKLLGNCVNCPMSESTMRAGIVANIKQFVPEIKEVVAVQ